MFCSGAALALLVSILAYHVHVTNGALGWDECDYLATALKWARSIAGGIRPINSNDRPPLLSLWLVPWALAFGPDHPLPLLYIGSVVPFALSLVAMGVVCRILGRTEAGPYAIVILAALPLALELGSKVLVETFLGTWVMMSMAMAALVLEKPTSIRAAALGICVGVAFMFKLSAPVFLICPAIYFLWHLACRPKAGASWLAISLIAAAGAFAVAGVFYIRDYKGILAHAAFAAHFDTLGIGIPDRSPRLARIIKAVAEVFGWPVIFLGVAATGLAAADGRSRRAGQDPSVAKVHFARMSVAAGTFSALFACVPAYFESRYLFPIAPACVVLLAMTVERLVKRSGIMLGGALLSVILMGVGWSLVKLHLGTASAPVTYWDAGVLLRRIGEDHQILKIGNVGNCADWNASKLSMICCSTKDASDAEVWEVSRFEPGDAAKILAECDVLFILDRSEIPPDFFRNSPAQNRSYDFCVKNIPRGFAEADRVMLQGLLLPKIKLYIRDKPLIRLTGRNTGRFYH